MSTHRIIFVDPDQWGRNQPKETAMSNKKISTYQPPEGVVLVAAANFDFFYDRMHGQDVIGLTCHDERLGAIAILFEPKAAEAAGHHLQEMATTDLQRLRTTYDERQQ